MPEAAESRQRFDYRGVTALIVDGNEFGRELTASISRRLRFGETFQASDAVTAFNYLKARDFDLVITDWSVPGISGDTFLRYIRTAPGVRNRHVAVVVMTAMTEKETVVAARDAGSTEFVARPIAILNLIDRLAQTLTAPRPFIKTASFTGPDRRRRNIAWPGPERRSPASPGMAGLSARNLSSMILRSSGMTQQELIAAAEDAVADEAARYLEKRYADLEALVDLVRSLKDRLEPVEQLLEQIYAKAKDITGMGRTFGYPLLSEAGDLLCKMIWKQTDRTACPPAIMQGIETHTTVISLIVKQDIQGDGGDLGADLIEGLRELVEIAARAGS